MLEQGRVKFFNGADNKRFGFIVSDNGDDVFFHYNGFRKFEAKGHEADFSNTGYNHPAAFPKKDEHVWFVRRPGTKGPIAEPWGYHYDYMRVKKEIADLSIYGESFIYISLCEGNLPETRLRQLGMLVSIPEDQREKYFEMMYERGFYDRIRLTRVIPHPGMEKKLGRAFRELSYCDALAYDYKAIEVVEIPKEHVYTGVLVQEFLKSARSLTFAETQKLVAMGKPAFSYSEYWTSWSRILGYYEDGYTHEVSLDLTSPHGWDYVKPVRICSGFISGSEKNEGPFTLLPDTVKDDMEEKLGVELTKQLLTENYLRLFTVAQLKTAVRNHTGGGGLSLDEILEVEVPETEDDRLNEEYGRVIDNRIL